MKVAIIGSGGREHAIAWKLGQELPAEDIILLPGNGGTKNNVPVDPMDFDAVTACCRARSVDLVVVGPEVPLAAGIVDHLDGAGFLVFGPGQRGARLESSKIWAKCFMARHGVATADFQAFGDAAAALDYARSLGGEAVVKYDGLAAGKGVFVCHDPGEVEAAIGEIRSRWGADAPFLVEERLRGRELSIIGLTDGGTIALLLPSQDHKQAFDGDEGPNTGGMGAFCPVSLCDEALEAQIDERVVVPTLEGLSEEEIDYRGAIYFGLMITDEGPKVLEYNVRLGDPEAEVVLPALETSLLELLLGCARGELDASALRYRPGAFVDVVLASGGYPGPYEQGKAITGLERLAPETLVFHAGTRREDGALRTAGGRVLNVVAHGADLAAAVERAYDQCALIDFEGKRHRSDIGRRGQ